jgi:hypothetical protein
MGLSLKMIPGSYREFPKESVDIDISVVVYSGFSGPLGNPPKTGIKSEGPVGIKPEKGGGRRFGKKTKITPFPVGLGGKPDHEGKGKFKTAEYKLIPHTETNGDYVIHILPLGRDEHAPQFAPKKQMGAEKVIVPQRTHTAQIHVGTLVPILIHIKQGFYQSQADGKGLIPPGIGGVAYPGPVRFYGNAALVIFFFVLFLGGKKRNGKD